MILTFFGGQRSREFGLGHGGLTPGQSAFSFTGFPLHTTHDHMTFNSISYTISIEIEENHNMCSFYGCMQLGHKTLW